MYFADKISTAEFKKYSKSNLPMKYINNDISEFRILGDNDKVRKYNEEMFEKFMDYYNNVEYRLKEGKGLIICGSVGIAKTWAMTCLAKKIIEIFDKENGKMQEANLDYEAYKNSLYYIQATTISQMVFPTGLNDKELKARRGIKSIACLWIDDISKMAETKSGHEISFIDDILRWRDLNCLTTLYTSQLPFDSIKGFEGLDQALSKPIHDMIRGNCEVITFRGTSQR